MLNDFWESFFKFLRTHLNEISMAYIATVFSIFGDDILKQIRKKTKKENFFVRLAIFIAICAFGFCMLTSFFGRLLSHFISGFDNLFILIIILGLFIIAGIIAEEKRQL